jgi:uncharacterized protein
MPHSLARPMIKRYLPTRESLKENRLLRWLGPRIHDPLLWHVNRNSVARGVAIGVFFGYLWVAALATLISNPFTYGPIYILAYRIGASILPPVAADQRVTDDHAVTALQWVVEAINWLTGIGRPLVLGMLIMAVAGAIVGYFGVLLGWRFNVIVKRRRQRLQRSGTRHTSGPR